MNLFILMDYSQIEILVENFVDDIFFAPGGNNCSRTSSNLVYALKKKSSMIVTKNKFLK